MGSIISNNNTSQDQLPLLQDQYNVYRNNKFHNLDDGSFRKVPGYISENNLEGHTEGKVSLSYTNTLFVNIFGLDLDVKGRFLTDQIRAKNLEALLNIIIIQLGCDPSIIFKSRDKGGIHCYYKLEKTYPFQLIGIHLREKFNEHKNIEILPTPTKPLRFPFDHRNGGLILNRELKPVKAGTQNNYQFLKKYTQEAPVYNFHELVGLPLIITNFILDAKTKAQKTQNAKNVIRFHKYLNKLKPIQGQTNEYIGDMAFNGVCNKMPARVVIDIVCRELDVHGLYRDFDTSRKRITERVESHYKRLQRKDMLQALKEKKDRELDKKQLILYNEIEKRVDKIFDEVFSEFVKMPLRKDAHELRKQDITKRKNSLRKFLTKLLEWERYIRSLTNVERSVISYRYNGFYRFTQKGATPLPYIL